MKLSEFKQLIKQSILEEKEKEKNASGAMTPEEEEMVADYEREQDAKHALDKEQPLEEAMVSPDNRVAYLVNALDHAWNMGKGNNLIDFKSLAQSLINDMFDKETMEEEMHIPDDIKWQVDDVVGRVDDYDYELTLVGHSPSTGKRYTASTTGTKMGGGDFEWSDVEYVEEYPEDSLEEIIRKTDMMIESYSKKK